MEVVSGEAQSAFMTPRTALLVLTTLLPVAHAEETPTITVQMFDMAGVPREVLARATNLATQIYTEAGVSLKWVPKAAPEAKPGQGVSYWPNSPAAVSLRLTPKQVSDRIVRPGSPKLGLAYDAGERHYRYLATIFYDRVEATAPDLYDVPLPDLLGHIIAHELGHLLLGPGAHTRGTIMACPFNDGEFRTLRRGQLRFNRKQAAQLRSLTAARIEAAKGKASTAGEQ